MLNLPRLAITLGDPAGIGPEVVLKAMVDGPTLGQTDLTIIGSRTVLENTYTWLRQENQKVADPANLAIIDVVSGSTAFVPGQGNAETGAASFLYMQEAIARTLAGEFHGIVTGPIAKNYWQAAGYDYPGQTELLAARAGVQKYGMLFVARSPYSNWTLRTILATTHIPLAAVTQTLNPTLLTAKLDLLVESLRQDFGIKKSRIAIAGINPHSGEDGRLGREEKEWLNDWIFRENARRDDVSLDGPIPPDTLWVKPGQAWYGFGQTGHDGYLAMYHDQGLIPVKLMAFDLAVNTTIGLPFIRTSPDHGTAYDIAGQGRARAQSMKAAIELAVELVNKRFFDTSHA